MRLLAIAESMTDLERTYANGVANWLLQLGDGKLNGADDNLSVELPQGFPLTTCWCIVELLLPPSKESSDDLIDEIYPNIEQLHLHDQAHIRQYFSEQVILTPLNVDVNAVNDAVMERLPGEPKTYLSADSAFQEGGVPDNSMPQEYLNILDLRGMPIHNLTLKVGSPINLMQNLNFEAELCNGTRMIINNLKQRVVEATILTGTHAGNRAFIPRLSLDSPASSGLPFTLRPRQFPFWTAFAMTINKLQGQSLSTVGVHLPNPVFAHGQLYVVLSCGTDSCKLHILLPPNSNGHTNNIVYKV
jgi:ATP-dependent DNA helicase PIF1